MKRILSILMMSVLVLTGCGTASEPQQPEPEVTASPEAVPTETAEPAEEETHGELLYLGHASLRITTPEGKVIYLDPYAPGNYERSADLILVTHDHYDHNAVGLVEARREDCRVITAAEALSGGTHQTFDLGEVTVEAVEAGNNPNHSITECVGYVLTLSDGTVIYISGDTSTTDQMAELADKDIDYAFFCCDGQYNMDLAEAGQCADLVNARHVIPYHTVVADGVYFDRDRADAFPSENLLIIEPGETISLTHGE